MRVLRSVLVVGVCCLPLAIFACVGDTSVPPVVDAGADAGVDTGTQDAAPDAVGDVAPPDAGPKCNYPDGGVPGVLDQTFQGGVHAEAADPQAGDVDPSGNIYVASNATNCVSGSSGADIAVFKYLPTGLPDTSFGTGGRFCIDLGGKQQVPWSVRADPAGGSILVTGASGILSFLSEAILVARVKTNGTLDTTFGTQGIYSQPVAGITKPIAYGLAFDTSAKPAKLIVVGADGDQFQANVGGFVLRLTAGGQVDNGFHTGTPVTELTATTGYYGAAADAAGNVFVTGSSRGASRDLIVRKLTVAGQPEVSFGTGGTATFAQLSDPMSEGRGVLALANGKVIVAGLREAEAGTEFIARLTGAGALDTSFAVASTFPGVLLVPSLTFQSDYTFTMLSPRCDGQYLLGGYTGAGTKMAVGRVSTAGTLDPNFGTTGLAVSSTGGSPLNAVEDPVTSRIILIGRSDPAFLERYNP